MLPLPVQEQHQVFQPSVLVLVLILLAVLVLLVLGSGSGTFPAGLGAAGGGGQQPGGLDLRPQRAPLLHLQPGSQPQPLMSLSSTQVLVKLSDGLSRLCLTSCRFPTGRWSAVTTLT